jgi:dUTPase
MSLKKLGLILPLLLILCVGIGLMVLSRMHKATVILHFSPETLTKSVAVKVGEGLKTDLDKKTLSGLKIATSADYTLSLNTTGTELEGEKAKGKVNLYNYTNDEVTVKKGTKLTYKNKDVSYVFVTSSEVKVPASTTSSPNPPDIVTTPGKVQVEVTAENIGESYNIKDDKDLDVKGYGSDELSASSAEDFKGGSSKEVKIVAAADITKLEQDLTSYITSQSGTALKNRVPNGYSLIDKSEKIVSKNVVINNKAGEKKDTISGSITAQVEGLTYSKTELADFMGEISQSQNMVPPGFEFHSYNKDIQVEVLGNTENTVLSPAEADLQVTFRFYIAPKVNVENIFNDIKGKNAEEAIEVLGKISDVQNPEISILPGFPFFNKVPKNAQDVDIQVKINE